MKPVMMYPPPKSAQTKDVTHPLCADLVPLDLFSSIGELNPYAVSNPATHHHHIPYSPERSLIAPTHSDS
jgi:hypothetical protein